jgi:hypothetical protein
MTLMLPSGIVSISPDRLTSATVGSKLSGLSRCLMNGCYHFFVVSADCLASTITDDELRGFIDQALNTCNISSTKVIIRSNGVGETIRDRGPLVSTPCDRANILQTLQQSKRLVPESETTAHWIVQELVDEKLKGLLSNERRLRLSGLAEGVPGKHRDERNAENHPDGDRYSQSIHELVSRPQR